MAKIIDLSVESLPVNKLNSVWQVALVGLTLGVLYWCLTALIMNFTKSIDIAGNIATVLVALTGIVIMLKMFVVRPKAVVTFIKKNPTVISGLQEIWAEMKLIAESKIHIISYGKLFPDFIETSKRYNLMSTDAILVEIMKKNGLKHIATNDSDFERIEGIAVWKP